ncbi:MAG: putative sugar O-methyltransferase, partial [Planctomycetota bacterium]|nr:putative sugar O-methyltransferase [Planctomycetota bacterium]
MLRDMAAAPALYRPTVFWQQAVSAIARELEELGVERFRSLPNARMFFVPSYAHTGYTDDPGSYDNVREAFIERAPHPRGMMGLDQFLSGETYAYADYRVYLASNVDAHPYVDRASESEVGEPAEQHVFEGRRFSRSFLNYLLGINFLKRHVDGSAIKTVLEIGGGFGTLGEILLSDSRNDCFYINADIPPTSFAA